MVRSDCHTPPVAWDPMDETQPRTPGSHGPDHGADHGPDDGQPSLPLFGDEPIAYELTARARRVVAPQSLPDLSVVPAPVDPAADPDPFDTRPARARALRRSGRSLDDVAATLGVDPGIARRWCGEVHPPRRSRRRTPPAAEDPPVSSTGDVSGATIAARDRFLDAFAEGDAVWTARAALVVGATSTTTGYAGVLNVRDLAVASAAVAFLFDEFALDHRRIRVTLRVGAGVPIDQAIHRWADALGVPREHVVGARGDGPADEVEASIRISVPEVAAAIDGWREALVGR